MNFLRGNVSQTISNRFTAVSIRIDIQSEQREIERILRVLYRAFSLLRTNYHLILTCAFIFPSRTDVTKGSTHETIR